MDAREGAITRDSLCALILAHHSPELLERVLRRLDQFGVTCFVHVDARVDAAPFQICCEQLGASLVSGRVAINWGGFSAVEASLSLIKTALRSGAFTHFLLLSGDTYPVSPKAEFLNYLTSAASHIQVREVARSEAVYQRIARVYLPDSLSGALLQRSGDPSFNRYVTADLVAQFPAIEEVFLLKQRDFPWKLAKGSQWWCLTRSAFEKCLEVIDRNSEFVKWFKYSSVPDESFLHSMFLNFVAEPVITTPPVYTLWDRDPRPYVFETAEDFALLNTCGTVLARKFTRRSIPALDRLDAALDSGSGRMTPQNTRRTI